jgi:RNA polymerase sigma-70 factor (ECF subfamily)
MGQDGPEDELALIQRAATGDQQAFGLLVVAYEGKLLTYLMQMLGDIESARDVAQETFIALFYTLPRWHAPTSVTSAEETTTESGAGELPHRQLLTPWLYRIASNKAISLIRKRQVRQRVHAPIPRPIDDPTNAEELAWQRHISQDSFEDQYVAHTLLQEALSQLSEIDAACLVLHYVSGEHYQEIGARLGLSEGAVRKRAARALVVLRKVYLALDQEVRS